MGFDLDALRRAVAAHGRVARVVVAEARGSAPREVGAAMLVWPGGQVGTIGGGALEFTAAQAAQGGQRGLTRHPLGPALGQCCGGSVSLLTEAYDAERLADLDGEVIARPLRAGASMPLSVRRLVTRARDQGARPDPQLIDGWMVEHVARPSRPVWIWGAGHVGRAIAGVLAPLPDLDVTLIDTAPERFPDTLPDGVDALPCPDPVKIVPHAPQAAEHLIVTYSHSLDLALCHALLSNGFRAAGLIGSATKWARFRARLATLGHTAPQIARISCPIGDPSLGKHPQAIALGVAADMLRPAAPAQIREAEA